ncbi:hypothetical protein MKQ68_10630 [Chitinophaga horti]|uniref:Alpha glucuronidase N-terminal domain-containing protein n=1 Tax=Chitinophaga horti TaxID=2920382 RepID=A0ABY6J7A9_9BACT|nr:glycoside hydrolase family 20 zincin-like fold domain-containing protein [Chitinophaga horti]UYQ95556.1 hypothetical protein MKQ68_10630 [Chitinophaga horti]
MGAKQTSGDTSVAACFAACGLGVQQLTTALKAAGYQVVSGKQQSPAQQLIVVGKVNEVRASLPATIASPGKEGFILRADKGTVVIAGADDSGVLYGCLSLRDRLQATKRLPAVLDETDQPEMVLRGACIGVQKPYYLPGRTVYEYPYTPEVFPWLYDKQHWLQYLDSMATNRMNALFLWNGHPFASLVKLKDYPYALEVDEATFRKNEEIYTFITSEADKRGIWVIQMFYNIIVSKPFAERHGIKTQERERPIVPLIADYTRKSIAAFVEKYPNVGLMVCLGEAMEGVGNDDIEWFTKTIIPGVRDGLQALGKKEEPPIVLRAHDTDAPAVMKAALPLYKNLYTEAKFNGEALTTPRPRGSWAELHQTLSKLGSVQIENVHILANLEPFRYGSPDFIQQSVKGMHEVMGGNGLHLYPQASYWDWPYSADSVKGQRLLQIERDWIWYNAWARYAWKANRPQSEEKAYWAQLLAAKFGCSVADGHKIRAAYDESGEIAPKLLRRFGITDGNRQTLTLGMLMTQLVNPFRYGLFTLLYDGESPEGEMIIDYADKAAKGLPHVGETPPQVAKEVILHGDKAAALLDEVAQRVTKDRAEFERLRNDMHCYRALAHHFSTKVMAATQLLQYKYTNNVNDLESAVPLLTVSVQWYRELAKRTAGTYLYANSMQTQQRKIPMRGVNATYKHWTEMLPVFEAELNTFRFKIDSLKQSASGTVVQRRPFKQAAVRTVETSFMLTKGSRLFTDTSLVVKAIAAELEGMKAVQLSYRQQLSRATEIQFTTDKPVKIAVGFFKTQRGAFVTDTVYAKPPELETNASADDYGQAEAKISNAVAVDGLPAVNVHLYHFKAGTHTLKLPKGICLVIGFIDGAQAVPVYDAMLSGDAKSKNIDWLFERQ